ncbi:hypothetical protein [Dysgonomonas capnocytophagoides]|uniref:hypothetical protein n=1 Tax=Dysgonomonas capnocytophagoides TaxID=45254 RepID=UPI002A7FDC92|nr:hypothetical protein [Dysgonomonas capnocytophagoides]
MEKFKDQPIILIQVKGMGFSVLVDTSYRYNLLAPYFIDFFHEKHPASPKTIEFHEWLNFNFPTQEAPIKTSLYLFEDIFQKQEGIKRIKCKDNISRGCESVIFNYEYNGKAYSELFYIDQSLCSYNVSKISGILGTNFLKKHKWIIDFNKQEIRT